MGIPIFTAKQIIRKLKKAGFYIDHQTGSHVIMRDQKGNMTIVPLHTKKDIKKGLMLTILKQADIELDEFLKIKSR